MNDLDLAIQAIICDPNGSPHDKIVKIEREWGVDALKQAILDCLSNSSDASQLKALEMLRCLGLDDFQHVVTEKLQHPNSAVRSKAAIALITRERPEAVALALEVLRSETDPQVRADLIYALAKSGQSGMVQQLLPFDNGEIFWMSWIVHLAVAMLHKSASLQQNTIGILGRLKVKGAVEILRDLAECSDDAAIKHAALTALTEITGDPPAPSPAGAALGDAAPTVAASEPSTEPTLQPPQQERTATTPAPALAASASPLPYLPEEVITKRVYDETPLRIYDETSVVVPDERPNRAYDETLCRVYDETSIVAPDATPYCAYDETPPRVYDETPVVALQELPNRVYDETALEELPFLEFLKVPADNPLTSDIQVVNQTVSISDAPPSSLDLTMAPPVQNEGVSVAKPEVPIRVYDETSLAATLETPIRVYNEPPVSHPPFVEFALVPIDVTPQPLVLWRPDPFGILPRQVSSCPSPSKMPADLSAYLEPIPINQLTLSVRSYHCLMQAKIRTLGDLISCTPEELLAIRNLGRKSCEEIIEERDRFVAEAIRRYSEHPLQTCFQAAPPFLSDVPLGVLGISPAFRKALSAQGLVLAGQLLEESNKNSNVISEPMETEIVAGLKQFVAAFEDDLARARQVGELAYYSIETLGLSQPLLGILAGARLWSLQALLNQVANDYEVVARLIRQAAAAQYDQREAIPKVGGLLSVPAQLADRSIDELGLSARASNCLHRAGILTIGELLAAEVQDLLAIKNFGRKTLDEILEQRRSLLPHGDDLMTETAATLAVADLQLRQICTLKLEFWSLLVAFLGDPVGRLAEYEKFPHHALTLCGLSEDQAKNLHRHAIYTIHDLYIYPLEVWPLISADLRDSLLSERIQAYAASYFAEELDHVDIPSYQILLERLLGCVGDGAARVLVRRYGLSGAAKETLEEIGNDVGVTRERIRQIKARAETVVSGEVQRLASTEPLLRVWLHRLRSEFLVRGGVATLSDFAVLLENSSCGPASHARHASVFLLEMFGLALQVSELHKDVFYIPPFTQAHFKRFTFRVDDLLQAKDYVCGEDFLPILLDALPVDSMVSRGHLHHLCRALRGCAEGICEVMPGYFANRTWNTTDRLLCMLRQRGAPMHYRELADRLAQAGFSLDERTVLNALGRDERFQIFAPRHYGLAEWEGSIDFGASDGGDEAQVASAALKIAQPTEEVSSADEASTLAEHAPLILAAAYRALAELDKASASTAILQLALSHQPTLQAMAIEEFEQFLVRDPARFRKLKARGWWGLEEWPHGKFLNYWMQESFLIAQEGD